MADLLELEEIDADALQGEYDAARERLNQQREEFLNFSQEGRSIFRMMVLLLGVPATVLGAVNLDSGAKIFAFLTSSEPTVDFWVTTASAYHTTLFTFLSLAIGLYLHASVSGLEVRGIRNNTNPNDIYSTLTELGTSKKEWQTQKLLDQILRIEENDRVLNHVESHLAYGKVGIGLSIIGFVALILWLLTGSPINFLWGVGLVLLSLYSIKQFPTNYTQADITGSHEPVYSSAYTDFRDRHIDTRDTEWRPPKYERR